MDDNCSIYSMQSTMSSRVARKKRKKPLFQDVKRRLADLCSESEELTSNMEGMVRSLTRKDGRRSSLGTNSSINFGNESFLKTLKVPEIAEVNEEEEEYNDRESGRMSAFSVQVQDEVSSYKAKIQEYRDLIQEMTEEVERVDQENELILGENEQLTMVLQESEGRIKQLEIESNGWTKKFLGVLQDFEESQRKNEEIEENLKKKEGEIEKLKRQKGGNIQGEDVLLEMKVLFEENQRMGKELRKIEKEKEEADRQKNAMEENVNLVQSSYKDLTSKMMKVIEKKDFLKSKIEFLEEEKHTTEKLMEKDQEVTVANLEEKLKILQNENRELQIEVKFLKNKNQEMESELAFMNEQEQHFGLTSQLENSRMIMDVTQDLGATWKKGYQKSMMNITDLHDDTQNLSVLSRNQGDLGDDQPFDRILGESLNQEVFTELNEKSRKIEEMQRDKHRILQNKKEEISEIQEKLIDCQKDFEFKKNALKERYEHEMKKWKKEKKRKNKQIKQIEKKMVQLKIQACDMIVQKDELDIYYKKKVKLLQARVTGYESDIREYNLMKKTKDKRGLWDRMFS